MSDFIERVAMYVQRHAPSYSIAVHSPIIAQAILESASGTSELAKNANNIFGIKYREGRCKTCIGIYHKVGSEQNPDGSYVSSPMEWCKFSDIENSVIGYFDFINVPRYANLKGVTDPKQYLELIRADGYATSLKYVDNLLAVIDRYDLTKYDKKEEVTMGYTNSSLVKFTQLSPNHSGVRNHSIDRITPHCVVGQLSAETICHCFISPDRQASCNYGIGTDGKVSLCVEEKNRSWCSSSGANDHRAITIECASDKTHPYAMNDKVYASLIELCVDICKRNGKSKLLWISDKDKALAYEPKADEMLITVHRWFANKSCPGDWLYNRLGDLASQATSRLQPKKVEEAPQSNVLYRVQTGAYSVKANADRQLAKVKAAGFDTYMVQVNGMYKVQVGAYSKKSNAEAQLAKLKAAGFEAFITTQSGKAAAVTPTLKSVDEIAREVLQGKWGNGEDRKKKLTQAGYDYSAVQKRVNELV